MDKLIVLLLSMITVALPMAAQEAPVLFQRHYIGESTADFLRDEPQTADAVDLCRKIEADPDTYVGSDSTWGIVARKPKKNQSLRDTNPTLYDSVLSAIKSAHRCDDYLRAFVSNGHEMITKLDVSEYAPERPMWTFDRGHLEEIVIIFQHGNTYSRLRDDVSQKLGDLASTEKLIPKQNAFGASWNDEIAEWLTPQLHVTVHQANNPTDSHLGLAVESRQAYDAMLKKLKERPNSLD